MIVVIIGLLLFGLFIRYERDLLARSQKPQNRAIAASFDAEVAKLKHSLKKLVKSLR